MLQSGKKKGALLRVEQALPKQVAQTARLLGFDVRNDTVTDSLRLVVKVVDANSLEKLSCVVVGKRDANSASNVTHFKFYAIDSTERRSYLTGCHHLHLRIDGIYV